MCIYTKLDSNDFRCEQYHLIQNRITKLFVKLFYIAVIISVIFQESHAKLQPKLMTYPIATTILNRFSESFGRRSKKYIAPLIVKSISSKSLPDFCSPESSAVDVYVTHKKMHPKDLALCQQAGITELLELKLGYGSIIVVASEDLNIKNLTQHELYLAITKFSYKNNTITTNTSNLWQDIAIDDNVLPPLPIHIMTPSPDTKLRDIFEDRILFYGCQTAPSILSLKAENLKQFRELCLSTRLDQHIEEGDLSAISSNLAEILSEKKDFLTFAPPSALQDPRLSNNIVSIDGFKPTLANIKKGVYPLSAPIYLYVKPRSLKESKGLKDFLKYIFSEQNDSSELLDAAGFIPLTQTEMTEQLNLIKAEKPNYKL